MVVTMPIHSLKFSITNISILINGISCALINDNKLVYFLKEIEVVYCKYEISLTGTFLFPLDTLCTMLPHHHLLLT